MVECTTWIMLKKEQRGIGQSLFLQAGSAELTTWAGFITLTTSPGRRRGSGRRWSPSGITSSGSSSAASSREPCSSSTRDSYMGTRIFHPHRTKSLILLALCHMDGKRELTAMAECILSITTHELLSGKTPGVRVS